MSRLLQRHKPLKANKVIINKIGLIFHECFKRVKVQFEEFCYEVNKYNGECSLNEVEGKFVKVLEGI